MTTVLYTHPACLGHETGYGHPESAERLKALLARLDEPEFDGLERRSAPCAGRGQLSRAHDIPYISKVFATVPATGEAYVAPDTVLSPGSLGAAMRAAGAVCAAVDAVLDGEAYNAFCAVRPPGHHAAATNTMGFCVFNNIAIGVEQARQVHNLERIAVVDFDVHHGNGTEAIFRTDPNVMVASIHQSLIFPNTGDSCDIGAGNIVNVPLARNTSAKDFRQAFEDKIVSRLMDFKPELLFVSAGFDAHVRDPLGDHRLMTADFGWLTELLMAVADSCCGGRLVSALEGGYDPDAVAHAGAAHIEALLRH
jgi:acetoin utilization deacetylase AcuC-like enzyme